MKRFCLISFLLISVFFLFSVKGANAAPVTFTSTEYEAWAYVDYDDGDSSDDTWGGEAKDSVPVTGEVLIRSSSIYGHGLAYIDDGLNFYASAEAQNSLSDPNSYVYSEAYMATYLCFIASAPVLHVSFDYNLEVSAGTSEGAYAYAYAELNSYLYDSTDGVLFEWNPYFGMEAYAGESDSVPETGIDRVYDLISGHYYELNLEWKTEAGVYEIAEASAYVNNIQIEAVPIPSAVLLLGSGLIGLVVLRRKSS